MHQDKIYNTQKCEILDTEGNPTTFELGFLN